MLARRQHAKTPHPKKGGDVSLLDGVGVEAVEAEHHRRDASPRVAFGHTRGQGAGWLKPTRCYDLQEEEYEEDQDAGDEQGHEARSRRR